MKQAAAKSSIMVNVSIKGELIFSSMAYSIIELQTELNKVVERICNAKGSITVKEIK